MGFVILGSNAHCFTFFFCVSWKILMITEGHSGYEFKWSPLRVMPFVADPSYHDYHHSHNVGNFAANCYVWDVLFHTNVEYMDSYLKNWSSAISQIDNSWIIIDKVSFHAFQNLLQLFYFQQDALLLLEMLFLFLLFEPVRVFYVGVFGRDGDAAFAVSVV